MRELKNREEVVKKLAKMLREFDVKNEPFRYRCLSVLQR